MLELALCLVRVGEVEGDVEWRGAGTAIIYLGGPPVRFDPSVSLPIEGVGLLVGGSVCVPEAAHSYLPF